MKLTLAVLVVCLSGCAAQTQSPYRSECQYQAKLATPGTNSVIADVMREMELTEMCIANKSRGN